MEPSLNEAYRRLVVKHREIETDVDRLKEENKQLRATIDALKRQAAPAKKSPAKKKAT